MYEEYYHENVFSNKRYPQSIYHNVPPGELKVIGKPGILRIDAGKKVTGSLKWGQDIILPRMLHVRFKTAPYAHANVVSIDTSAAKALPGVVMVLTHDDIPDLLESSPDEYVLMKAVLHHGEEVAAVVAEEEEIAEEALTLISIEYDVLPFTLQPEEALLPNAPLVRGETNAISDWDFTRGDVDAGLAAADVVVGPFTYGVTKPYHEDRKTMPIDTDQCTAYWDGERLVLWDWNKNRFGNHKRVANWFGLPFNKVEVPDAGISCCFSNNRGGGAKTQYMACWVSMQTGRPVKVRFTQEQQFVCKPTQRADHITFTAGVNNDGTLVSFKGKVLIAMGALARDRSNGLRTVTENTWKLDNLYLEGQGVNTNTDMYGSIRCTVHPRPSMLTSMFMDRVAETIDMDPADFLLKNVLTTEGPGANQDNPSTDMGKNPMPGMLEKLIEVSGWRTKWKGWGTPMSVNGSKQRGIGIANHRCSHGGLSNPESANINAKHDGTFALICGSEDCGQGARTALALIAAEELGVAADKVVMTASNTSYAQESRGPSGSTVTRGSGTAVILAARDLKEQLFKATILDEDNFADREPEDLEMVDGSIFVKADPTITIEVSQVTARMNNVMGPLIGRGSHSRGSNITNRQWDCAVAEVEVDVDTGEVTILDLYNMGDFGRVIWYEGAYNQMLGGTTMSCGRAIFEAMNVDEATGIALSSNLLDYKIPTQLDIEHISVQFYEDPDPYGPFGARGVGEPLLAAPAPAVANAIYNAIGGNRILDPPITPDKILKAIGKG